MEQLVVLINSTFSATALLHYLLDLIGVDCILFGDIKTASSSSSNRRRINIITPQLLSLLSHLPSLSWLIKIITRLIIFLLDSAPFGLSECDSPHFKSNAEPKLLAYMFIHFEISQMELIRSKQLRSVDEKKKKKRSELRHAKSIVKSDVRPVLLICERISCCY